jgi:serine protease Do
MKNISRSLAGFVSAVAGVLIVAAVFHVTLWGKDNGPAIKVESAPVNRAAKLGTSFAPVIKMTAASVVSIYTTRFVREQEMRSPILTDPRFRQFFGDQIPDYKIPDDNSDTPERTRKERGLGSGVIISPDGYILTANHVVDGADEIKVSIADNKKPFSAKVIGKDEATDVAVLKIDANHLPAITLADSDQLEVGDIVLAIGNPFNVGQTVTMGVVSGLGRSGLGISRYEDFIQTDAAINPGNSGGALVDAEGRLIGINTAIRTETGGYQGIGYAVPVNLARHVMELLISSGKVTRGYLGINLQDITPGLAEAFNLPDQNGALVGDVQPNSPADKAGVKSGDVIVALNGKNIGDTSSLQLAISDSAPGSPAALKIIRDGKAKTVSVTLGELQPRASRLNNRQNQNNSQLQNSADALDGVEVADLDQQIRRQLRIPVGIQGAIVSNVEEDSNSAEAGLQHNDVILEINRQPVSNSDGAVKLCEQAKGDQIFLKVWRYSVSMSGMPTSSTLYLSVDNTKQAAPLK